MCVCMCVLQGIIRVLFDLKKVCANVKCARSTDDIRKWHGDYRVRAFDLKRRFSELQLVQIKLPETYFDPNTNTNQL